MTDKEKIREELARLYNQSLADENRQADRGLEYAANVSFGKSKACKELLSFIDSLPKEPVSNPPLNEKMSVERWKKACEAACCDKNYRSHYGLTETRDDYFVDGVQWADEHPKEEPVSVWHDAREEPEEGKDFAFVTYNGIMWARYRIEDIFLEWQRYRIQTELDKWAYVSDLLKL